MKIETIPSGAFATNCYILEDQGTVLILDPTGKPQRILDRLQDRVPAAIILTHGHFDHIGALKNLRAATNARVYIGEADKDDPSRMCHDLLTYTDTYRDGDFVTAGGLRFQVLATPGHTPGSVCLLCENVLFSGDTLFAGSYGRTDFLGGSSQDMAASLKRLSKLPPETRVLPGHGASSTIEEELRTNPYLRGLGIE